MRLLLSSALASCALLLCALDAGAATAAPTAAEKARGLIELAEFDRALKILEEALTVPDTTPAERVKLHELQGTAWLYLGNEDRARAAFARLLELAPEHQLPRGTSPKLRTLFEAVREEDQQRRRAVRIAHRGPTEAKAGEPLQITADIQNLPSGARARLFFRRSGEQAYSSAFFAAEGGERYAAAVPAFELPARPTGYQLEYYIEVADGAGQRLAAVASALEPNTIAIAAAAAAAAVAPAEPSSAWYQKWWVWAIAGGVAAGATAAIVIPMLDDQPATLPVNVRIAQ